MRSTWAALARGPAIIRAGSPAIRWDREKVTSESPKRTKIRKKRRRTIRRRITTVSPSHDNGGAHSPTSTGWHRRTLYVPGLVGATATDTSPWTERGGRFGVGRRRGE